MPQRLPEAFSSLSAARPYEEASATSSWLDSGNHDDPSSPKHERDANEMHTDRKAGDFKGETAQSAFPIGMRPNVRLIQVRVLFRTVVLRDALSAPAGQMTLDR